MKTIAHVADTAYWVATYRARESARPDALFHDPLAQVLVGDRGQQIARSMKSSEKYSYWSVILRTRVIDQILLKHAGDHKLIVNLGAGLDTRPYRLDLPADVTWIEIDFPGIVELKNEQLGDKKAKCQLERIALDLSDREARRRIFAELNSRSQSMIVLTEGVIPYLTEEMVTDLAADLKELSNVKLWVSEFYANEVYPRFQSAQFSKSLGEAAFQFFPEDWFGFFARAGWKQKEIRYLYDEGEKVGRSFPLPWFVRLIKPFVPREKMAQKLRLLAYIVFEKS